MSKTEKLSSPRLDKKSVATKAKFYLNELGIINALGVGKAQIRENLLLGESPGMDVYLSPILNKTFFAGIVANPLPEIPQHLRHFDCKNNQLALAAALQMQAAIDATVNEFGAERVGVVMGTSTSGVAETELAMQQLKANGQLPADYHYSKQEVGAVAEFLADYFSLKGPAFVVSTACSSSGKVFASARGLIEMDLCDAVLVGGADSLCELTLSGFASLEAIAEQRTNPFSLNRNGINIGEGAALFLLTKKKSGVQLLGVGESSDAHHISAPDPSGAGAGQAMLAALTDAGLDPSKIDYVNLHGTGTRLNDEMESHAVHAVFAEQTPCSSTKPLTGHTLGAAGATEAGLCWLLLNDSDRKRVVPHVNDKVPDAKLSSINLCNNSHSSKNINITLSNSFAFGGNNVSVILARI